VSAVSEVVMNNNANSAEAIIGRERWLPRHRDRLVEHMALSSWAGVEKMRLVSLVRHSQITPSRRLGRGLPVDHLVQEPRQVEPLLIR
jgi:hypothetical protein